MRRDSDASHGDAGSKVLSVERSRIVSFLVSFQGFHSRVSPGALIPGRISAKRSTSAFNTPLKGQSLHAVFPTVCRQTWDCLSYHLLVSPLFVESCSWSQLNLHSVSRRPLRKILFPSPREHQEKTQRISGHFSLYSTRTTP